MKTFALITYLFFSAGFFAQVPIQFYDFETNGVRSTSETSAEFIINSVSDNNVTSVGGALSNGSGNPSSGSSLFRNSWDGNGATDPGTSAADYIQFLVSTSGFSEIFVDVDVYGNLALGTAGNIGLLYSIDGSNFTAASTMAISSSFATYQWDLSAISSLDNESEITFRFYTYTDLSGLAELYIDNLTISASKITTSKTLADYSLIDDANGTDDFPVFSDLTVDGSGNTVTLSSDLYLSDLLRLDNGIISTSSNNLILDASCTLENYSTSSYINGNLSHTFETTPLTQTKVYPVGSSTEYRPIEVTLSDITTAGTVMASHTASAPSYTSHTGDVSNISTTRYWSVDLESGMTFGAANTYGVELHFGANDGISDASAVKVVRGINGGAWSEADNSGNSSDWVFGSFNSPTDNDFTFGDDGTNPLPVELREFDYYQEEQNLILYWTTATEINSFMFEIERQNPGSGEWEKRGYEIAAGVSNSPKHYSFLEEDPVFGVSKYRLKIIDNDGSYEYSKTLFVEYDGEITDLENEVKYTYELNQNFPNPFNPSTTISYSLAYPSKVKLEVYNIVGELIMELEDGEKRAGRHNVKWNATDYPSGIYILRMTASALSTNLSFVKSKKMILMK